MMMQALQGVVPILLTPFDAQERVDVDSLQSLVDFQVAAGVHGVGIALGSEVMKLTEAERGLVTRTVADRVAGRVPLVVNSGGESTFVTVINSREAQANGADAVMIIPPAPEAGEAWIDTYRAVGKAVDLPIFIQDVSQPHVAANVAKRMAEACPSVRYIKVESHPTPAMVAEAVTVAGDLLTVFGGAGGATSSRSYVAVPKARCRVVAVRRLSLPCGRAIARVMKLGRGAPSTNASSRSIVSQAKDGERFTASTRRF